MFLLNHFKWLSVSSKRQNFTNYFYYYFGKNIFITYKKINAYRPLLKEGARGVGKRKI